MWLWKYDTFLWNTHDVRHISLKHPYPGKVRLTLEFASRASHNGQEAANPHYSRDLIVVNTSVRNDGIAMIVRAQ